MRIIGVSARREFKTLLGAAHYYMYMASGINKEYLAPEGPG